jgi:tetrahydromethanopterin S-methyltransferase subunit D
VAFLPIVGAGTAMALGAGVGTGVAMGSRDPAA